MRRLVIVLGALVVFGVGAASAGAAVFRVNTRSDTVDVRPGDGRCADATRACSLRAAIEEANASPGANTIEVPPGGYLLTRHTGASDAEAGDLDIGKNLFVRSKVPRLRACREGDPSSLTIIGAGHTTVIDGDGFDRVFEIHDHNAVTLANMEIVHGNAYGGGGILVNDGACLRGLGLTIAGNRSTAAGGGIESYGFAYGSDVDLIDTSLIHNHAATDGGGIELISGVATDSYTRSLTNVTIANNVSDGTGGGIDSYGHGTEHLTNVTISGNYAPIDSAVDFLSDGMCAPRCDGTSGIGNMTVRSSIFVGTCSGAGFSYGGRLVSGGHNIEDGHTCGFALPTDLQNTDPLLGSLSWTGGQTPTVPLLPDSPAIDDGDATTCPPADQRGVGRVGVCDSGAYEYQPSKVTLALDLPAAMRPTRREQLLAFRS